MNAVIETMKPNAGDPTVPDSTPIFIVGVNGSGTTMLLDALNNHSEVYGFPRETRELPDFLNRQEEFGDLGDDANFLLLWNQLRGIFTFRKINGHKAAPLPDNWQNSPRSVAGVF